MLHARVWSVSSIERGQNDISENNCATAVTNSPLPAQGSPVQLLPGVQVRYKGFPGSRLHMRNNLWLCFVTLLRQLFITRKKWLASFTLLYTRSSTNVERSLSCRLTYNSFLVWYTFIFRVKSLLVIWESEKIAFFCEKSDKKGLSQFMQKLYLWWQK